MLYDVINQSYEFENDLFCDVIMLLDFEDLTLELSNYIAYRAARKFQEAQMQSAALDNFTVRAEMEAYAALMDSECENRRQQYTARNARCFYATYRNHSLAGR